MATSTKAGMLGYIVRTVVNTEHHLIVAHEVANTVSDKVQLTKMIKQGQAAIERKDITAPSNVRALTHSAFVYKTT